MASASCLSCDPVLRVRGDVRDSLGVPIGDAAISLSAPKRGPHLSRSSAYGSFDITIVGAREATLSVSKPGYQPRTLAVALGQAPLAAIVLDPAPSR